MRTETFTAIAFALLALGCEEDVTAVLGTHRAYSVYGFFDARADTQAMRVYAIETRLDVIRPDPLDAEVTSLDAQLGQTYAWTDSVAQFGDGRYGHVFWAPFRAAYGHRYAFEVKRSDGVLTRADVTVPPLSEPELEDPTVARGFVVLPVMWPAAPRLNNIRVLYYTNKGIFTVDYPLEQQNTSGGSRVEVQMSADARDVFSAVARAGERTADVRLSGLELFVLVSNEDWVPPDGEYDTETLVEPGTFSNVENGYGFVGAGYDASFYFEPPDSMKLAAGYFIN